MFGLGMLDVFIGLAFIYLLLGLFCTVITEWISGLLKLRATTLKEGIEQLLGDPNFQGLAKEFYAHPVIAGLKAKGTDKYPSYISADTFTAVVCDLVRGDTKTAAPVSLQSLKNALDANPDDPAKLVSIKQALRALLSDADKTLDDFKKRVAGWFDEAMERVSGWYRRRVQLCAFLVAAAIAIAFNADTIGAARALWSDPGLREAVVKQAEAAVRDNKACEVTQGDNKKLECKDLSSLKQVQEQLRTLPVGWSNHRFPIDTTDTVMGLCGFVTWLLWGIGLLVTAAAVSLGAPFWYDVLKKLINLRSAGGLFKPEKPEAPEKAGKTP